ncbi:5'-nucleotidase [Stutzerimonas stutzeri]|uniref:5'-nucleotidase n=1 Tax=Stutzerimonas stutzeri TaxID=316 RepID=UPI0003799450|nr:5'-nucleotidase [Stutzerimonas stutzeri]
MALDFSKTLVVGISPTALFDMSESDQMFKAALEADTESVIDNYRRYMQVREDDIFFDDQDVHLEAAANLVPSGKVPYLTRSALTELPPAASV